MYKLPIDFVYTNYGLLYTLLEECNLNLFVKDKNKVPAIIKLCSQIQYRKFVDWWVCGKLKNNKQKEKFVVKIEKGINQLEQRVKKLNHDEILFYFVTICRLKKSVRKIDLECVGVDKNNLQNSTNKLGALFYYVNFIADPTKINNKQDEKLLSFYKSIENIILKDDDDIINKKALKDPIFNITPAKNSILMGDPEDKKPDQNRTLRTHTYLYENRTEIYQ